MIHLKVFMAAAVIASTGITGCSDPTAPPQLESGASPTRSGIFRVVKNCSTYQGGAGQSCTITSSTLEQIQAGSTITYTSGVGGDGLLSTDVVLDLPGPGNNAGFGHCTVDLRFGTVGYGTGACELTGGTGKFTHIHTHANVRPLQPLAALNFEWVGTDSFSSPE